MLRDEDDIALYVEVQREPLQAALAPQTEIRLQVDAKGRLPIAGGVPFYLVAHRCRRGRRAHPPVAAAERASEPPSGAIPRAQTARGRQSAGRRALPCGRFPGARDCQLLADFRPAENKRRMIRFFHCSVKTLCPRGATRRRSPPAAYYARSRLHLRLSSRAPRRGSGYPSTHSRPASTRPRCRAKRLRRPLCVWHRPRREPQSSLYPTVVIIGSDQVAELDGLRLDKPGSRDRAQEQLQRASGREVVFHTAVTLLEAHSGRTLDKLVPTRVRFRALTASQISAYLDAEQPYDCAGSAKSEGLGIASAGADPGRRPHGADRLAVDRGGFLAAGRRVERAVAVAPADSKPQSQRRFCS